MAWPLPTADPPSRGGEDRVSPPRDKAACPHPELPKSGGARAPTGRVGFAVKPERLTPRPSAARRGRELSHCSPPVHGRREPRSNLACWPVSPRRSVAADPHDRNRVFLSCLPSLGDTAVRPHCDRATVPRPAGHGGDSPLPCPPTRRSPSRRVCLPVSSMSDCEQEVPECQSAKVRRERTGRRRRSRRGRC